MPTFKELVAAARERIREVTNGFHPPEDACNTYLTLFNSLHQLERNMHQHIHKENNILFPRARALEDSLTHDGE